jgi:hypothetical protein
VEVELKPSTPNSRRMMTLQLPPIGLNWSLPFESRSAEHPVFPRRRIMVSPHFVLGSSPNCIDRAFSYLRRSTLGSTFPSSKATLYSVNH